MSLIAWIKSIFGASRKRDISRLSPASGHGGTAELDAAEELVDVSGGPLKEHHLRRALRDKRLLPKIKSPARQLGVTKRKKIMSVTEAGRLFGGTMRVRPQSARSRHG